MDLDGDGGSRGTGSRKGGKEGENRELGALLYGDVGFVWPDAQRRERGINGER